MMGKSSQKRWINWQNIGLAAGVGLVGAAALLPTEALVTWLRGPAAAEDSNLLVGAVSFRIMLALLGLAILVLSRLKIWSAAGEPQTRSSAATRSSAPLILAAILAAAALLRLYQLNSGLWLDEITTNLLYARAPFGTILTTFDSENQHFLYSLLAHLSLQVFGDTAGALRLPAVLFGLGSIWATFLLGRELVSEREGLLAAALLAFSYQHIWFSQDARGYTGLLFWTMLSTWLLVRAQRESRPALWLYYAAAAALGVYTHITMLFVVAGQFLVYLAALWVRRRQAWPRRWAGLFLGFGFSGLLTLLLYSLVLPQVLSGMGREASVVAEWKNPLWTMLELVRGTEVSFAGGIVAAAAVGVLMIGLLSYARTRPELIIMLIAPTLLCIALVVGLGHHLWPRFFFFELGLGALVVIRGAVLCGDLAARILRLPGARVAWPGVALGLALVAAAALSIRYVYGPKQDYAGALEWIQTEREPGDAIVTTSLSAFVYQDFFKTDWRAVHSLAELQAVRSSARRTWVVYTFQPVLDAEEPEISAELQRDFRMIRQFDGTVSDGTVFITRSDAPPGGLSRSSAP